MARTGDWKARHALRASGNLARVYSASQLGVTLASLAIGALAEASLGGFFAQSLASLPWALEVSVRVGVASTLAIAIVTFFHVVFGELVPRAFALSHPEELAGWLTPPLLVFAWLLTPFASLLNKSSQVVARAAGLKASNPEENVHSPEELRMLVEQSQEVGALQTQDANMLEGVFEFSEKNAHDVMTPRTDIDALAIDATLDETLALVDMSRRSRYPVYEETIDNIVGVVLAKDLLRVLRSPPAEFALSSIMRPVHVVPGSREVEEVLADFKRQKEHLAIVLDEYGGTAGLVTMEDLLEEIVGEIFDEYDELVVQPDSDGSDRVVVPGSTNIGDLNERFGLDVPDDAYTTVGGYIFGALGRLPVVGDRLTAGGAVFTVREMDGRRINELTVDLHSAGDRRAKEREDS